MTKPNYRYHKVHYRRIEAKAGEPTFEQLCREALEAKDSNGQALALRPDDRVMSVTDGDVQKQVLMNRVADLTTAVFGEICLVLPSITVARFFEGVPALLRLDEPFATSTKR